MRGDRRRLPCREDKPPLVPVRPRPLPLLTPRGIPEPEPPAWRIVLAVVAVAMTVAAGAWMLKP